MVLTIAAWPAAAAFARAPEPTKAPKADRDGDGVFEDLEQRLASAGSDTRVKVIVSLEEAASAHRVASIERGVGPLEVSDRFRVVDAFAAEASKEQVGELARLPGVVAVERDAPVRALNDTAQEGFGVTAARQDMPAIEGSHDGRVGSFSTKDMVAAVADTGIDTRHRDLNERKVIAFADCINHAPCRVRTPYDDHGHGTHISATIAGDGDALADRRRRGVAPGAALVGVKVLAKDGLATDRSVVRGLDWVIANRKRYGIEAVNLSLGGLECADGSDVMSRAANRAAGAGLTVVAAAGNSGPAPCTVNAPAVASGVLAVGAMADPAHNGFLAHWTSGRGAAGQRIKPDVMGPGVGIVSAKRGTLTGYSTKTGTSTASAFASGVALLMKDVNPSMSGGTVRERIKSTAVDWGLGGANTVVGSRGPDIDFGWGRLDAYRALRAVGASQLDTPPPLPAHRLFEGGFGQPKLEREYELEIKDRCRPIAVSMIVSRWNGYADEGGTVDFDLHLYDPSGQEVEIDNKTGLGEGATDERQEDVSHRPEETGTYALKVKSWAGTGSYVADASAGFEEPPPSAPESCGPPPPPPEPPAVP